MTFIQAIILGILQGATEFLPVSSSGHLAVTRALMEVGDIPILFDILLHVATLLVVGFVYRKKIGELFISLFRFFTVKKEEKDNENMRFILIILLATVITAGIGISIEKLDTGSNPRIVSILFLVTALILIVSHLFSRRVEQKPVQLKVKHGIITGIAQGLGVFPGISRSGITISAGLMAGLTREQAAEFSFIMSIPAILGSLLLEIKDMGELFTRVSPANLAAGFIAAVITGFLCLNFLIRLVRKGRLYLFAVYLIPLGIFGLIFL